MGFEPTISGLHGWCSTHQATKAAQYNYTGRLGTWVYVYTHGSITGMVYKIASYFIHSGAFLLDQHTVHVHVHVHLSIYLWGIPMTYVFTPLAVEWSMSSFIAGIITSQPSRPNLFSLGHLAARYSSNLHTHVHTHAQLEYM